MEKDRKKYQELMDQANELTNRAKALQKSKTTGAGATK
jgi:hypothetical protein